MKFCKLCVSIKADSILSSNTFYNSNQMLWRILISGNKKAVGNWTAACVSFTLHFFKHVNNVTFFKNYTTFFIKPWPIFIA